VDLGLHLTEFSFAAGPSALGQDIGRIAVAADEAGLRKLSVMDHLWQIRDGEERAMLEAYTTLGFLAAKTSRIELFTCVTAVTYREPGLLAKAVTTLDVLSGGRAWLGIGAAWNEAESRGLGLFFPPTPERFERLEESLQIFQQMCSADDGPYRGKHYTLERTLNSPQSLSRPHPRILIGGGGEKKTLRLVAQYAQACNLFVGPELARKLDVLRRHCDELGRDYEAILKTVMLVDPVDMRRGRVAVDELVRTAEQVAALGVGHVHFRLADFTDLGAIERLGENVVPVVATI
jgi:alkanesulfonate monooxygenase